MTGWLELSRRTGLGIGGMSRREGDGGALCRDGLFAVPATRPDKKGFVLAACRSAADRMHDNMFE
jgi:hypothetical protein